MPYAYISAYQVLYCQLIKLKCLSDKPYHYEEFKSINYNITDSSSLAVVKLHIDCIDRIEKIKEWLPAEAH